MTSFGSVKVAHPRVAHSWLGWNFVSPLHIIGNQPVAKSVAELGDLLSTGLTALCLKCTMSQLAEKWKLLQPYKISRPS